jgi:hypothetical protein
VRHGVQGQSRGSKGRAGAHVNPASMNFGKSELLMKSTWMSSCTAVSTMLSTLLGWFFRLAERPSFGQKFT